MSGDRVLVTGADGFIGSHLVEELVRRGYDTKAFVYYNSFGKRGWLDQSDSDLISSLEVVSGDIRDENCIRKAMLGCSKVYHLAALIAIPFSYEAPASYIDTNIKGTLNIVQAAKDLAVEKVVVASTSEVYGTAQYVPIDEKHPLQGQSPYSASKIGADQLAMSFFNSFDTPVAIARPFNTYGPRQSFRAIIPATIIQLLSGRETIKLGSLTPKRDFNYVSDTVSGFISVANSNQSVGEVINLGSNFSVSMGDTVALIAKLMNRRVEILSDDARIRPAKSEVEVLQADNTKAKNLLDWEPQFGSLIGFEKGLSRTIEWFTEPNNLSSFDVDRYYI